LKSTRRILWINLFFTGVIGSAFGWVYGRWWLGALIGLAAGGIAGWFLARWFSTHRHSNRGRLRRLLVFLLFESLLIIYVIVPGLGGYQMTHPIRIPIELDPADLGLEFEEVSFVTSDDVRIAAWYLPTSNGATVICGHGFNGNRTGCVPNTLILAENGFGLLLIDHRAQGESQGERFSMAEDGGRDFLAAFQFLLRQDGVDPDRIGVMGLSAGGQSALYAAAQEERIVAVVADGAGSTRTSDALDPALPSIGPPFITAPMNWMHTLFVALFGGEGLPTPMKEVVTQLDSRPVLFIAGALDPIETDLARRYARLAGPEAEAWIIPDAGHLAGIWVEPEAYPARILAFFQEALLPPQVDAAD
jgi:pimeloyl-ACP methyl ester carboxylesterase